MLLDAPPSLAIEGLAIEEVESADRLEALRPEWEALWDRSPRATVFQHPAWLLAWWRHLGGGGLWTLVVRRDGKMVGIAPLFVWSGAGERQVTPVGNGISDRVDLLAAPGMENEVAAAVLAHLAASPERWETADFRDLPADSALLRTPPPDGIAAEVEDDVASPVLPLSGSGGLEGVVPAPFLKKLSYYRRRLERDADAAFEAVDRETLDEWMDALARLHGARWAERGEPGVLGDARVLAFHREVAGAFLARGVLRMHGLRLNGAPAAVFHGFAAKGRAWYYLGGFDPAWERHSVGTVIVGHAMEIAVREGAREFDFLRGGEPYKYAWGAADRPARRLRLRRSIVGKR